MGPMCHCFEILFFCVEARLPVVIHTGLCMVHMGEIPQSLWFALQSGCQGSKKGSLTLQLNNITINKLCQIKF